MTGWSRRLGDWVGEFAEGLILPSRLSAAVALASFTAVLAVAVWFFSAPVLSGPLGRFLARSQGDAEAQATWRALQLRHAPPDRPQLLILGSSALANAVASEPAMRAELARSTGRDWSVSILTTPAQSTLDQLTLIDAALGPPPGPRRPVVIAIEMSLMREHLDAPRALELERMGRLGVRSDWADQAVAGLGGAPRPRSDLYWIDNYSFVVLHADKTLTRLFLGRSARTRTDGYGPPAPLPADRRQRPKILAEILAPHPVRPLVYAMIDVLFRRLHAYPHVHVVFVETRLSPDFVGAARIQPIEAAARSRAISYAAGHASEYWPIVEEAAVPASAYYDDLHIATAPERARIRASLARHLADYIRRRGLG
jgi:hypothetical protein